MSITMRDHDISPENHAYLELLCSPLNIDEPLSDDEIEELQIKAEELESEVSDLKDEVENEQQRGDNFFNDLKIIEDAHKLEIEELEEAHQEQVDLYESIIEDLKAQLALRPKRTRKAPKKALEHLDMTNVLILGVK